LLFAAGMSLTYNIEPASNVTVFPFGFSKNFSPSDDNEIVGFDILTADPVTFSKLNKRIANRKTATAEIITFLSSKFVYIT